MGRKLKHESKYLIKSKQQPRNKKIDLSDFYIQFYINGELRSKRTRFQIPQCICGGLSIGKFCFGCQQKFGHKLDKFSKLENIGCKEFLMAAKQKSPQVIGFRDTKD